MKIYDIPNKETGASTNDGLLAFLRASEMVLCQATVADDHVLQPALRVIVYELLRSQLLAKSYLAVGQHQWDQVLG